MELFSVTYWALVAATLLVVLAVIVVGRQIAIRDNERFISPLRTRKGRAELLIALAAAFTPFVNIIVLAAGVCWMALVGLHIVAFPERKVL